MNIYMYIGSFFFLTFGLIWLYTLHITLYLTAEAYIHGRPAVRSNFLRIMISGTPSLYSEDRRKYQLAGLDYDNALTGENVAGVIFIGGLIVFAALLAWPIVLTVLVLRNLRRYNTDEEFRAVFEREVKNEVTMAPKPKKKLFSERVIKGLD